MREAAEKRLKELGARPTPAPVRKLHEATSLKKPRYDRTFTRSALVWGALTLLVKCAGMLGTVTDKERAAETINTFILVPVNALLFGALTTGIIWVVRKLWNPPPPPAKGP